MSLLWIGIQLTISKTEIQNLCPFLMLSWKHTPIQLPLYCFEHAVFFHMQCTPGKLWKLLFFSAGSPGPSLKLLLFLSHTTSFWSCKNKPVCCTGVKPGGMTQQSHFWKSLNPPWNESKWVALERQKISSLSPVCGKQAHLMTWWGKAPLHTIVAVH